MSDSQFSPELLQFIHAFLWSYDAAVILVFLSRDPERTWTVEEVLSAMGMDPGAAGGVRQHVENFGKAGVLELTEEGGFRVVPVSHPSRAVVEELRMAYDHRPVTLIRAIDSATRSKIQSFADAFKLKRERE